MRILVFALAACGMLFAADPPAVSLQRVASGFQTPLDIRFDASGRMFVVEQRGTIRIVKNGTLLQQPFLDLRGRLRSGDEQGLLGLALAPDFAASGIFYVNYTDTRGDTVVSRMRSSNPGADTASNTEEVVLRVAQPFSNHNGGNLVFGRDGYLYIGLGDGGSGGDPQNNGQNTDRLLGKMLRIDVQGQDTYKVPSDNPFVNRTGYRPEFGRWVCAIRGAILSIVKQAIYGSRTSARIAPRRSTFSPRPAGAVRTTDGAGWKGCNAFRRTPRAIAPALRCR